MLLKEKEKNAKNKHNEIWRKTRKGMTQFKLRNICSRSKKAVEGESKNQERMKNSRIMSIQ